MASKNEVTQQKDWAARLRIIATWLEGTHQGIVEALANEIDPEVEVAEPAEAELPFAEDSERPF